MAQVIAAGQTPVAVAARQHRFHRNAVADVDAPALRCAVADLRDAPQRFVARHHRHRRGELAFELFGVRAADAARLEFENRRVGVDVRNGHVRGSSVRTAVCTIVNAVRGSVSSAGLDALCDGFLLREFVATPREFGAVDRGDVHEVVLPARIVAPRLRRDECRPRRSCGLEQPKRRGKRRLLRCPVERLAGGIAERKVAEVKARYADVLDDIARAPHHNRWYAVFFEVTRDEARRLMADRAVRHQQGDVRVQVTAGGEHIGGIAFERRALAAIGRQSDQLGCKRSNVPARHRLDNAAIGSHVFGSAAVVCLRS